MENKTVFDPITPELASKVNQKPPTIEDLHKFNRQMVTRELPTVSKCGHKIDPLNGPRTNCFTCWATFFNSDQERVVTFAQMLTTPEGKQELEGFYGSKYIKMFTRFLVAVNELIARGDLKYGKE